jgi:hypothetical protein
MAAAMSGWTHTLCEDCWDLLEPGREAVRVKDPPIELCCRCGALVNSGIYYRFEPKGFDYCDHSQEFSKGLRASHQIVQAHMENLIERVYMLEANVEQLLNNQQETGQ